MKHNNFVIKQGLSIMFVKPQYFMVEISFKIQTTYENMIT